MVEVVGGDEVALRVRAQRGLDDGLRVMGQAKPERAGEEQDGEDDLVAALFHCRTPSTTSFT